MPTKVKCLASLEAGKRDLWPDDIEIKILYCGICHSDIHHGYQVVPGHEIVGKVFRVGADVSKFQVGDSVGVGCMVNSCQTCATCKNDREQYCDSTSFTYGTLDRRDGFRTYGGYTETIVVTEKFVLSIPASLDLAGAAPLLCAGITTYSPLLRCGVRPRSKVGVVGLGGLSHMALKLAKSMSADVTLFSPDHFLISSNLEQMEAVSGQFELIIDTVPYNHDPTVNSAPLRVVKCDVKYRFVIDIATL
ncbi:chaperonin 10-like protein [Lipomyces doorenjongii]|uniref:chaperonin 10-like protein n=1 Tax=Lipomyces doorenjongii TaxID=383834 RepID=UPI0034CF071B